MPVVVYGFIDGYTTYEQDSHNSQQIRALPESGGYLIKNLFSFVPQNRGYAYYGSHIHFAAGYKEFYILDSAWIDEFESLLSKLYWNQAEVVVTWSKERYVWSSDYSADEPDKEPNKIVKRSRFESAWDLKEIPWAS